LEKVIDNFEIIVVDDDSPDATWKAAEELVSENSHLRVIRRRGQKGLATAVVEGWKAAKGDILGAIDGDLQHPPETLSELLESIIGTNVDIAVASRHVDKGGVSDWNMLRRLVSWGASFFATFMLPGILRTVRDPMSGYFLVRRRVIESVALKPRGYKILLEVLAKGKYKTVTEVPYIFEERKEGGSKLGPKQYMEFVLHIAKLTWETGHAARFLRFSIVGLSGVFVNQGALQLLTDVGNIYYVYSSVLAVEMAIISNFLLNDLWTFRDRSLLRPAFMDRVNRFLKFNLICAFGGVLNTSILWGLTDLAGFHYLISNLFGMGVSALWNYGINSNITWESQVERKVVGFDKKRERFFTTPQYDSGPDSEGEIKSYKVN
jgi:dolichol-phosphate mannosyltransferase